MKLTDFDFDLPPDLIATRPARPRSSARLLLAEGDRISDRHVYDLPQILNPGDLLVLNDTKVIPARLNGTRTRKTGQGEAVARIEITLLNPALDPAGDGWQAMAKPLRKLRVGDVIRFGQSLSAEVAEIKDGCLRLRFDAEGEAFDTALAREGAMPLPPYIASLRAPDVRDHRDYQTVWASRQGAVAAPTASLHFDAPLLESLKSRGVQFAHVTLHVGAGTFLPVKVDDVATHKMHAEWGEVSETAATAINTAKAQGRRIIPVGTTALRLIESAATPAGILQPFAGTTEIFIYPGYQFRVSDGLMTNFHLPKSTLLMLVSALMGMDRIQRIYAHAVMKQYRFFSYGDASLLLPPVLPQA